MESKVVVDSTDRAEMERKLNLKFRMYDFAVKKCWVEDPEKVDDFYDMLEDPTVYAYAFFRDKRGNPIKMYYYQDAILNDASKRVIFAAARQLGKSTTAAVQALHFALHNPGTTTMLVSKTLPQTKDLLRKVKEMLQFSLLDYKSIIGDEESKTGIYFRHYDEIVVDGKVTVVELPQSRIICVPATEASLGYSNDLLIIDELAFYDDAEYFYTRVVEPTTYATKGKIICLSNPNGRNNYYFTLWTSPEFSKYKFTFLDCPNNTEEEYINIANRLTREQRDSTLDAIFTDSEGSWLTYEERRAIQKKRENILPSTVTQGLFVFFDWAKSGDRTVRVIGVPILGKDGYNGVYIYEMYEYKQGTPYDVIVADLRALIADRQNRIAMVGWDNTGVGKGVEDFIKKIREVGVQCNPVEFSLQNKSRIYTLTKVLIERSVRGETGLDVPYVSECDRQLSNMIFQKSSRGYLQIHHANEKDRDDYPDAIVGLCSLIIQPDSPPVTVTII